MSDHLMSDRSIDFGRLAELRNIVKISTGFDLYLSSQFIESFVCYALYIKQTQHSDHVDGVGWGLRVEVKHTKSRISRGNKRYEFKYVNGTSKYGKNASVHVLVGWDMDDDDIKFWIIPSFVISGRKNLSIDERYIIKYKNEDTWVEFMIDRNYLFREAERAAQKHEWVVSDPARVELLGDKRVPKRLFRILLDDASRFLIAEQAATVTDLDV